jgi:hypothetical protein
MRVAATKPNKSHVPDARNSHHRQLPIPSHTQQPLSTDSNLHSCLAEFHLQHYDQISTITSHSQLRHLPQKNSSLTAPESVDWKPRTCLTSPPTITPFSPSRPRMDLHWRMRRTQLSTVRLVKALHSLRFPRSRLLTFWNRRSKLPSSSTAQLTSSLDASAAANAVKNHPITQSVTNGILSSFWKTLLG